MCRSGASRFGTFEQPEDRDVRAIRHRKSAPSAP
jgi:hypothetical protein